VANPQAREHILMPTTTMLLTLFLIGVSAAFSQAEDGLSAQEGPRHLSAPAPEASETTGDTGGNNAAAANHDSTSALTHRTTRGERMWGPIARGALIGTIVGGILGLVSGAAAGAIMSGVVRALP
jgi:hypothetical protein